MIAKITKTNDFHNLVNYILDKKKDATLIGSCGVMTMSNQVIIKSFDTQVKLRPNLKVQAGHISISFHKNDLAQLTDIKMVEIAEDYLGKMGIVNTQYIIGRHFDKESPHFHIAFNRVDNNGNTISDKNDFRRSEKICKELKIKYGLYFAQGKESVKVHRLREPDKSKYEIYEAIKEVLPNCTSWENLTTNLKQHDINVQFRYRSRTNNIQGVSFSKNGYVFSGSKIDRACSYSKLSQTIENNVSVETQLRLQQPQEIEAPTSLFVPYLRHEEEDDINLSKRKKKNNKNKRLSL